MKRMIVCIFTFVLFVFSCFPLPLINAVAEETSEDYLYAPGKSDATEANRRSSDPEESEEEGTDSEDDTFDDESEDYLYSSGVFKEWEDAIETQDNYSNLEETEARDDSLYFYDMEDITLDETEEDETVGEEAATVGGVLRDLGLNIFFNNRLNMIAIIICVIILIVIVRKKTKLHGVRD